MIRPTVERLRELFRLDGGRLYWAWFNKYHPDTFGKEAGVAQKESGKRTFRWIVKIGGRPYRRAHIVFALTHGRWPELLVDHANGDSLDDRPGNLREATQTQNAWNHRGRKRRIPLPMGVRPAKSGRFQARIGYHGKQLHLGCYETAEAAATAYRAKRKELYGEFA